MTYNSDMIKMLRLLEGQQKFAGEEAGQKPGDQVRGTDQAKTDGKSHPFKGRLVGEDTTLEDKLAKKYQDFKELQAKEKAEKKEKEELDEQAMAEGFHSELEMELHQLTKSPDMYDAIYNALGRNDSVGQHLQDMMYDIARGNRLHPDDDHEQIIDIMADHLEADYGDPDIDKNQGVAEGSQDKTVKIVKRRGRPIGEIGIDPEASPGNGSYYVKLYDGSVDLSGFDTAEEALAELKYLVKQSVAEGLDPTKKRRLYDLIELYRDATEPNDYYDRDIEDPDEVIAMIRSEFGDKIADQVAAGAEKMHYPRHSGFRSDPLGWKKPVDRITKAGKMYKQDSDYIKNTIKSRYALSGKSATEGMVEGYDEDEGNPVMNAITGRIMRTRPDLLDYNLRQLQTAIRDVALDVGDVDEIGSSDISGWVRQVEAKLRDSLNQHNEGQPDTNTLESQNPTDKITVDVPLMLRIMEYAREDAQDDMDLHDVTERLIQLGASGKTLSMSDYDSIVAKTAEQKLSELGATPPAGTAGGTATTTTGNAAPTTGSVSPDEQAALNKIQTNPAMKAQLDKLMTQAKPAQSGQPMKLNPDQEDALEKIKANAGLKTQYDKIIQQANPQAKV